MFTVKTKGWGNSIGVIIPKEEVERMNICVGEELILNVEKSGNALKDIFGTGKYTKSTKQLLNESRKNESKFW